MIKLKLSMCTVCDIYIMLLNDIFYIYLLNVIITVIYLYFINVYIKIYTKINSLINHLIFL
jgi:hypothetical protein